MREAHGAKIERIRRGSGRRDVGGATPLDRLVEAFGDIVVLRDKRGRILQANAAFAEATGCTEPGGRSFLDFCAVSPEGDGQVQTLTLRTCDGTRVYDWRELAGRDPETGAAVIHAIGREIAGRDPAEHELIAARERAEEANATKSRFLAMVSHELRTPLNGILGMARLLGKTRLTREQESYVGAVRHSGHALLALVEDLLDFSGMEAGKFMLRPEPGNLQELVESVVELSAARADEKGIEIAAQVAPDVPETIVADHRRLRQVLFNLIGNAVKFTDKGGILVEVLVRDDLLEFRVEDSGPGIAETDRQRIFHEFEQIDSGPTRRDGAGLGLAISARLAAAMGGTLTLESETGKGSTFILRVPFETTASAEPAAVGQSRLEESKVLLVAPSGPTSEALLRLIRDRGGCAEAVEEAAGVADALAHLGGGDQLTDIIVDHRLTALGGRIIASLDEGTAGRIGRTMMVTPIERDALTLAKARDYSAWLIRPLRAASVAKVLRRETNGFGAWVEERRPEPAELSIGGRAPAGVAGCRLKVLLAEDNPVNALLVRAALERNGHEVTHVADGYALVEKAYDRARITSLFDLVLTDLSMPKMDGIAAVTAIRGFERNHAAGHLPIIVLSADGQHESHAKALEIGADDYVEKPVDPDLLLQTVERAAMRAGRMTAGR